MRPPFGPFRVRGRIRPGTPTQFCVASPSDDTSQKKGAPPMAETPQHHIRETSTLRFARFVTRNRLPIATMLAATTLFFMYPIVNAVFYATGHKLPGPIVRVNTSARALYPDHPFINAQDK